MKPEIFSLRSESLNSMAVFIKIALFLILISVAGMILTQNLMAEWSALGSGMNYSVQTITSDISGNLYAGGGFTTAGGVLANRVAKWNGSSWSALGSGMNDYVFELASDLSGNLYAGGRFTTAGGVPANYVAKWNGSSWIALGSGMNNFVTALAIDSLGNLYAGGRFTTAGEIPANSVAKWDGSSWIALGSGMDNAVYTLASDSSGNLYTGGDFTTAGGVLANYVAKWNGSSWSALGSGVNFVVIALMSDSSGNLYAGGDFTTAGGIPASYVAKWNGSSWITLGSGMNNYVWSLASDISGSLYAGGIFTTADGVSANRVAKWNGSSWNALGSGMNNFVNALASDSSGNLYAGGDFTTADGIQTNYVAKWTPTPSSVGDSKAIIIAGGGNYLSNTLWEATKRNTDFAHNALIFQGYKPESIYYLSENNGFSTLINGTASKQNLEYAITSWAKDADNLLIYMADHGGDGTFRLSETEILHADELAGWLDDLQQTVPGNLILVYDACRSGSFVRHLKGQRRILLTSASDGENAIFASDGTLSFSWLFWSQIYSGRSFYDAFANTKNSMGLVSTSQHSLIDADGDGVANSKADTEIASGISIGDQKSSADDFPTIGSVSPARSLTDTASALIYADNVVDSDGIKKVWAVITPPNYVSYSADTPVISLPTVELKSVGSNRYEATYDRFTAKGSYKIVIFATDNRDFTSLPEEKHITSVTQTQGNSCVFVNNDLALNICAEYQGVRYGCTLNIQNSSELIWQMDVGTFRELQNDPGNCIAVGNGLKLDMCVEYQGKDYGFTMNYDKDLIWKMDVGTFKTIN